MTKLTYLEKQREMAYHNLMCYSYNLSMTTPKIGCEEEWQEAKEECKVVERLICMVKGMPNPEILGAAVIDGKVVHNWQKVWVEAKNVASL